MKKRCYFGLLAILMLLCLPLLAACGNSGDGGQGNTEAPESDQQATDEIRLSLATGSTSGNYYPFGGAIAQVVKNRVGYLTINVNASGASAENIQQLANGDTQLAIVQNDILDYAFRGSRNWQGDSPVTNLATLMTLYPEAVQLVVAADSAIRSVADLEGKRVSLGDSGSGVEANALQVLEVHELDRDYIIASNLGFALAAEALKAQEIDAFFTTAGTPNTAMMNLQSDLSLRIISLEEDKIADLIERYPFYIQISLDETDYSFLSEPITTVAVQAALVCTKELDEQVAYDLVKALIEGHRELESLNAKGSYLNAQAAVQGVSVELHPGARRYYESVNAFATPDDEEGEDGEAEETEE